MDHPHPVGQRRDVGGPNLGIIGPPFGTRKAVRYVRSANAAMFCPLEGWVRARPVHKTGDSVWDRDSSA